MEIEERKKVLMDEIIKAGKEINLKNNELEEIFKMERKEMFHESNRNLEEHLDDLIVKSLKDVDLEEFTKEDNDDS
jgi:hypothetical protein